MRRVKGGGQIFERGPFRRGPLKKLVYKWHFLDSKILGADLGRTVAEAGTRL